MDSKRINAAILSIITSLLRNASARYSCIDVRVMFFHPALRGVERLKSERLVQAMRVAREQRPAAQPLQVRMGHNALHQPLGEAATAEPRQDVNVSQIREGCTIADDAGKPYLLVAAINSETYRVADRALHYRQRNSLRPVGCSQEGMHSGNVKARIVGADLKLIPFPAPGKSHRRFLSCFLLTTQSRPEGPALKPLSP